MVWALQVGQLLNKPHFQEYRTQCDIQIFIINQYLQVINFSISGFAFKYISGVYFSTGLDLTNSLKFKFNLGISEWQIYINSDSEVILINLKFVALFLIVFIDKLKKKIKEDKLFSELSQVGQ